MSDLEAMKAAFLAKGGKVAVVAEGTGLGLTNRQWYARTCDPVVTRPLADDCESQSERAMEAFRGARMSGASMEVAMNEYNGAR